MSKQRTIEISRDEARFKIQKPELQSREIACWGEWADEVRIIFERDGSFWKGYYEEPKNGHADYREFENEVECVEVFEKRVFVDSPENS